MLVCIVNKIPLFLSGHPGCSKTSSINIIIEALKGKDSKDPLL
jgi:MoxR-like ATPase